MKLRIVAAAIRDNDGDVYVLQPPARHHTIIHHFELGDKHDIEDGQGFLLSDGRYARRKPALRIAIEAGQIVKGPSAPHHGLFSEDVW